jgi:hypothetical protein
MVRPRKNTLVTVVAAAATRETQRKTLLSSHTHTHLPHLLIFSSPTSTREGHQQETKHSNIT